MTTNLKPQNYSSTNKYQHNSKPKWHLKSFHSEFNIKQIHTFNLSQIIKTQIDKQEYPVYYIRELAVIPWLIGSRTLRSELVHFCSVSVRLQARAELDELSGFEFFDWWSYIVYSYVVRVETHESAGFTRKLEVR